MVEDIRQILPTPSLVSSITTGDHHTDTNASKILDQALLTNSLPTNHHEITTGNANVSSTTGGTASAERVLAAVEATVTLAESNVKSPCNVVHNPLEAAALDADARLAASTGVDNDAVPGAKASETMVS